MFDKLLELYFNFWDKLGVGANIALIILFFLVSYFIIKNAVKNGILSAYEEVEGERNTVIDNFTPNKKSKDNSESE